MNNYRKKVGLQFFGMKNLDAIKAEKDAIFARINQAVTDGDSEEFGTAFTEFTNLLQESVLAEARGLISAQDNVILQGRGVRTLTSTERNYYNKFIDAARETWRNPQAAVTMVDEALPLSVFDAIWEDLTEAHPLLGVINFQNTGLLTNIIVSDGSRQVAKWGELCDEIDKEVAGSVVSIDLTQRKLFAKIIVCKAMLEIGPEWLDRYVRAILAESLANGLEAAIIDGNGLKSPVGILRDLSSALDETTGKDAKSKTALTQITPTTYGALLAALSVGRGGLNRTIGEVVFIVNPTDYYTKLIPAVTIRGIDGQYYEKFPYPTRVIQSAYMPQNTAAIGIAKNYFFGVGTGSGGKIEYSDHVKFLDDARAYTVKLYGNGQPLDNTSFIALNITNLAPVAPIDVNVTNTEFGISDQPIEVYGHVDARLASLKVGAKDLVPTFNKSVFVYACATTDATNTITAVAKDGDAVITIKNGETGVDNGAAATWSSGENTLTVKVEVGGEEELYTVIVTKS